MRKLLLGFVISISLVANGIAQMPSDSMFVRGEVYVQFKGEFSPSTQNSKIGSRVFDQLSEKYGVYAVKKTFPSLKKVIQKTSNISALERIHTVYFDESHSPKQIASAFIQDPNVIYAEPKLIRYIRELDRLTVPDDPLYAENQSKYFELLSLPKAWEIVKGEQGDALIAIVDDGVYWKHDDLFPNVWSNPQEVPSNGIDDDNNGYVDDVHGYDFGQDRPYDPGEFIDPHHGRHGTAVAAVAVATTNNDIGMAGSSWNAKFVSVGVQCDTGGGICDGSEAIVYAATLGADIINASFGGAGSSRTESLAIQAATDMGALVVAAAGNEGWNVDQRPSYPADYPRVLSVGGTSNDFDMVLYNYGTNVDVYAAGRNITAPLQGGYSHYWSGTSFSTPLVSGIAALVKTAFPTYTSDQIREQIRFTADPVESSNVPEFEGLLGFGRVNALRAVTEKNVSGVVLDGVKFEVNDGGWRIGSNGHVEVILRSHLSGASDVEVHIVEAPEALEFPSRTIMIGTLSSGTSNIVTIPFRIKTSPNYRTTELYVVEVRAAGQVAREAVLNPIDEWDIKGISSEQLAFDVSSEGNIGFLDQSQVHIHGFSHGRGIHFKGEQQLMNEVGLIIGTGPNQVSRSVDGIENGRTNIHFRPKSNTEIQIQSPGGIAPWQAQVTLVDTKAPNPTGLEVIQNIYFDPGSNNSGFAIVHYTISNPTKTPISNLHVGMLFDWIISDIWIHDITGYNFGRGVGYQYTNTEQRPVMGAKVLTHDAEHHYVAYDLGIYPFPRSESSWWFMSSGVNSSPSYSSYWGQVFGTGPYPVINPSESVEAAFAFFGGDSIDEMLRNADRAQDYWDTRLTDQSKVQFLMIDSDIPLDVYSNGDLMLTNVQPENATKFLAIDSGDTVIEMRVAGESKTSDPMVSTDTHFDSARHYQIIYSGVSSELIIAPDARQVPVSKDKMDIRAFHGIQDISDIELRVVQGQNYDQLTTLQVTSAMMSNYVELASGPSNIEVWDLHSNELIGTYSIDTDLYVGTSVVLMLSGSASNGITMKSFLADGTELQSSSRVNASTPINLPSDLILHGNYPNPFKSQTQIQFDLPSSAYISVEVIDLIGRRVWQGPREYIGGGYQSQYLVVNHRLSPGVYLYRLLADTPSETLIRSGQFVVVK